MKKTASFLLAAGLLATAGCAHYELAKAARPSPTLSEAFVACFQATKDRRACLEVAGLEADRAKGSVDPIARSQAGWGQPAPFLLVEEGTTIFFHRREFFRHRDLSAEIGWGIPDDHWGCGLCRGPQPPHPRLLPRGSH